MNRQQLSAVRRVLKREKKNCKNDDLFQRPGLHPSMGRHLATDGHIAILLDSPRRMFLWAAAWTPWAGQFTRSVTGVSTFPWMIQR